MQIQTVEDFVTVLEEQRSRKKLTQRELSLLVGKNPSDYWKFTNQTKNMTITSLLKYCNTLGLKITIS